MNREELFQFIRQNPVFYLATCEDDEPHVRAMTLFQADEDGIVFNTCRSKDLHRQLLANPKVEMCFYSGVQGVQVRIRGLARPMDQPHFRGRLAEQYPVLASSILKGGPDALRVFQLHNPRAWVWEIEKEYDCTRMADEGLASIWLALYPGAHKVRR